MYCDYYGFREKPFNITPDPGFIFLSDQHREAFAHLLYGIDSHVGFISLTGEVGTGKTTVIRTLLGQLTTDKYRTALIFNPCLSSLGLMQHIGREYGLQSVGSDLADILHELNQFLLRENAAGRTVVLVIDEAQNLEPSVLEQIRLISNLETERDKLIQIVLVGQPELRDLLHRRELRQLGQRVAVSYHLLPMGLADTHSYITHRLETAGRKDRNLFTPGAVKKIFAFSRGFPRVINLVCDRALLLGYTRGTVPITSAMAAIAVADIDRQKKTPSPRNWRRIAMLLAILMLGGGAILYYSLQHRQADKVAETRPTFTAALVELSKQSEPASAVQAFNELARHWKIPPVSGIPQRWTPEELARDRGLDCYRVNSHAAGVFDLGLPVVVEVVAPHITGKRYLAITGIKGEDATIAPSLLGVDTVKMAELKNFMAGRACIPWKNYLEVPANLKAGSRGEGVKRLQGLLRGAGVYSAPLTGTFDRSTTSAVKAFQQSRGIEETGVVGRQTLMLLYRSSGDPLPSLSQREKKR